MSCECKDCGEWIEHYVGHRCKPKTGTDSLDELVSKIEVARQTNEYDWELLCGPYADIEHAKIARDDRRKGNKGDNIQIIAFIDC